MAPLLRQSSNYKKWMRWYYLNYYKILLIHFDKHQSHLQKLEGRLQMKHLEIAHNQRMEDKLEKQTEIMIS